MVKKNKYYQYLEYSSVGIEIVAAIAVGSILGVFADIHWGTKPYLFFLGFIIGLGAAIQTLFRLVRNMNKHIEKEEKEIDE